MKISLIIITNFILAMVSFLIIMYKSYAAVKGAVYYSGNGGKKSLLNRKLQNVITYI